MSSSPSLAIFVLDRTVTLFLVHRFAAHLLPHRVLDQAKLSQGRHEPETETTRHEGALLGVANVDREVGRQPCPAVDGEDTVLASVVPHGLSDPVCKVLDRLLG